MNLPAKPYDGSTPLERTAHERYARARADLKDRGEAYRIAFPQTTHNITVNSNAYKLERRLDIRTRIEWFTNQSKDRLLLKRDKLEEQLWEMSDYNIADLFESKEETDRYGEIRKKMVLRDIHTLPLNLQKAIQAITWDRGGNPSVKMHDKVQINVELRKMLGLDRPQPKEDVELRQMTNAQLVESLAKQANELGVKIDLNYRFSDEAKDALPGPDVLQRDD